MRKRESEMRGMFERERGEGRNDTRDEGKLVIRKYKMLTIRRKGLFVNDYQMSRN